MDRFRAGLSLAITIMGILILIHSTGYIPYSPTLFIVGSLAGIILTLLGLSIYIRMVRRYGYRDTGG